MQQLLFLVPKKGKEFSQNHGESCNTQARATNVNKFGDIYTRSIILHELVVLWENQRSKTFSMLIFFLICTRTKQVYSINGPKFGLEVKQLLFPLFRPNTILVKNLETLACVFPSLPLSSLLYACGNFILFSYKQFNLNRVKTSLQNKCMEFYGKLTSMRQLSLSSGLSLFWPENLVTPHEAFHTFASHQS